MFIPRNTPPSLPWPGLVLALVLATTGPASAAGFEPGPDGTPAGWERRTRSSGTVAVLGEGTNRFVRLGVTKPGEDSFIQRTVPLPPDTARVRVWATCRCTNVVPGKASHQRGAAQARFLAGAKETGAWVDLAKLEGSQPAWVGREKWVTPPAGATAIFLRLALYGVQDGTLDVADAGLEVVASNRWAEAQAALRQREAIERARYRPDAPFGEPVPAARLARLARGVNVNNWFGQPYNEKIAGQKGAFTPDWFARFMPDSDLAALRRAGFTCIRLPVDPEPFMDLKSGAMRTNHLAALDAALGRIRAQSLAVVVDAHPKLPGFKVDLPASPDRQDAFILWWRAFAAHLAATTDPEWTFLEPMNEPGGQKYWAAQPWWDYQDRLFTAIRAVAPRHTLIGNAGAYMLTSELERYTPHPDRNIVYSVHYYEPSPFTHQGAVWMKDWYRPFRQVPWPLTSNNLAQAIAALDRGGANAALADRSAAVLRNQVNEGRGTPEHVAGQLAGVAAWGRRHDRRLFVGEFGVLKTHAAPQDRCRWIACVRRACETNGLAWAHWEYQSHMGFAEGEPGSRRLDPAMLEAFGLAPDTAP